MRYLWALAFWFIPTLLWAQCPGMGSPNELSKLLARLKSTNPLMLENYSLVFEISACEKEVCLEENQAQRLSQRAVIHLVKLGEKTRVRFLKGPDAPQCLLRVEGRDYKCIHCGDQDNQNCRAFAQEGSKTRLQGTNLDRADFDFLEDANRVNLCEVLKDGQYWKITASQKTEPTLYPIIEIYLDPKRETPLLVRFFTDQGLFKVYRFFPKYYIQKDQKWVSTWFQVRNVSGREDQFQFETSFKILKGPSQDWRLYFDTSTDPMIGQAKEDELFKTP